MVNVSMLARQLEATEADKRQAAALQLSQLGEESRPATLALVRACGDAQPAVSEYCVAALEQLGPPPSEAAGALAELVSDANELVAYWAVTLLGRLGVGAASAVEHLATVLRNSPHIAVQQRAAWALGQIGVDTAASRTALEQAVHDPDARLSRLAGEALARIS